MRTVELKLLPHQHDAMTNPRPFVALVTGVGGGKTWCGARWLVLRAWRFPEADHLATGNTFRQIKDVMLPQLRAAVEEMGLPWRFVKSDFAFETPEGGRILLRSTENYDALRGLELASWWADEIRDAEQDAVNVLVGRLRSRLCDRPRYLWTSTPNGFDHIYEQHVARNDPECALVTAHTSANPHLPPTYVESLLTRYDERRARQELAAEFLDLRGARAYTAFDEALHVPERGVPSHDWRLPLHLCIDFNVDPMAAVLVQDYTSDAAQARVNYSVPRVVVALDEIVLPNSSVYEVAEALKERALVLDHAPLIVNGDASGNGRTAQTGRTDYALLVQAMEFHLRKKVTLDVPGSNPPQRDRVNAVNALLRNAKGERRALISRRCSTLIGDLRKVKWDDKGSLDKRDPALTHASDAFGYFVARYHAPTFFRSEPEHGMRASAARSIERRRS